MFRIAAWAGLSSALAAFALTMLFPLEMGPLPIGAAVAAAPPALDVLENLQLLAIVDNLGGDYAAALSRLSLFTAFKWLSIAVVYATWIPGLWSRGWLGRLGAGLAALNAVATVLALATRGVAAELMGLGSGLTVIAATTLAWRSPRSS